MVVGWGHYKQCTNGGGEGNISRALMMGQYKQSTNGGGEGNISIALMVGVGAHTSSSKCCCDCLVGVGKTLLVWVTLITDFFRIGCCSRSLDISLSPLHSTSAISSIPDSLP